MRKGSGSNTYFHLDSFVFNITSYYRCDCWKRSRGSCCVLNPNRDTRKPFPHYFVTNLSIADLIVWLTTGSMSTIYHIFAALRQHDEGTFWDGDDCRILRILHGVSAQPKSPGDGPKSRHHATSDLPALSRYCWFQVWCGLCPFCFQWSPSLWKQYMSLYLSKHSFSCHHVVLIFQRFCDSRWSNGTNCLRVRRELDHETADVVFPATARPFIG